MRHSKQIKLILLGTVSAISLTACFEDSNQDLKQPFFTSIEECSQTGRTYEECKLQMDSAQRAHEKNAPKYTDQTACQLSHNQCYPVQTAGGGQSWLPFMMGYWMGNSFNGGYYNSVPAYVQRRDDRNDVMAGQAYNSNSSGSSSGGARYVNSYSAGGGSGGVSDSKAATSGAVSRGGFGATGAAHGSSVGE